MNKLPDVLLYTVQDRHSDSIVEANGGAGGRVDHLL